jgi:hypothetical protein
VGGGLEQVLDPGEVTVHPGVDPRVALPRTVHPEAGDSNHTPHALATQRGLRQLTPQARRINKLHIYIFLTCSFMP